MVPAPELRLMGRALNIAEWLHAKRRQFERQKLASFELRT
jgi:hypothetical protein